MKVYYINRFVKKRLKLSSSIAHSRLMIRCNYHPEFFSKLLVKQQIEQSDALRQEREISKK